MTNLPQLDDYRRIHGWFGDDEMQVLIRIARANMREGGRAVEIGSYLGRTGWALGCVGLEFAPPCAVYCVDPGVGVGEADNWSGKRLLDQLEENLQPLSNVTVVRTASLEAVSQFADGSLDMVWIDGAHDEASVADDILAWRPKLNAYGVLCGHDFDPVGYAGLVAAVERLVPKFAVKGNIWIAA